tara:strand:- start:1344 stop:1631 length:288 start_codon:yes stop_codon:yes gene_type:complete
MNILDYEMSSDGSISPRQGIIPKMMPIYAIEKTIRLQFNRLDEVCSSPTRDASSPQPIPMGYPLHIISFLLHVHISLKESPQDKCDQILKSPKRE